MNFQFLIESLVAQFKDIKMTKKTAEAIVKNIFEDLFQALKRGEKISVRGFGTFDVVEKKGRVYVEPRNQQKVEVGPTNYVKFIPSGLLKSAVKGEEK